jgi:hypothetical protein
MVSEGCEFEPATLGPTSASTCVKQLEILCRNFASLNTGGVEVYSGEGNTIRAFWAGKGITNIVLPHDVQTKWIRRILSCIGSQLQASFLAFHPSFRMIDDTSGYTERRLSNIMESLRALSLSELLP